MSRSNPAFCFNMLIIRRSPAYYNLLSYSSTFHSENASMLTMHELARRCPPPPKAWLMQVVSVPSPCPLRLSLMADGSSMPPSR